MAAAYYITTIPDVVEETYSFEDGLPGIGPTLGWTTSSG